MDDEKKEKIALSIMFILTIIVFISTILTNVSNIFAWIAIPVAIAVLSVGRVFAYLGLNGKRRWLSKSVYINGEEKMAYNRNISKTWLICTSICVPCMIIAAYFVA